MVPLHRKDITVIRYLVFAILIVGASMAIPAVCFEFNVSAWVAGLLQAGYILTMIAYIVRKEREA
jgi:hypothetical protein